MQVQAAQARAQLAIMRGDVQGLSREIALMDKYIQQAQRSFAKQAASAGSASAGINRATAASRANALANQQAAKGVRAWVAAQTAGMKATSYVGNQIQWAGRQLQYNFTLPLVIAGAAATKWAMDQEAGMVRIKKVYGDGGRDATYYKKEILALGDAFTFLSEKYGVAKTDTENIAADWAAAGSSGLALAKQTDLTMKTMVLGEMDAADATKALIAIQAQYRFSSDQLGKTINTLNMIENQTGITMQGLVQGFSRAAGVARDTGVDVLHLGAMLAALVPASGTATQAGNALKTIMSRLISPTKEASQVMKEMGINTKDLSWQNLNGAKRIELIADKWKLLNNSQKGVFATVTAGRQQLNRLDVLLGDVASKTGYYAKATRDAAKDTVNRAQAEKELKQVLDSSPQKMKIIWTILQNAMVDIIEPLIPSILRLSYFVSDMAKKFANLSPHVRDTILALTVLVALVGPLGRYIGSLMTLLLVFGNAFKLLFLPIKAVGAVLAWAFINPIKAIPGAMKGALGAVGNFAKAGLGQMVRALYTMAFALPGRAGRFFMAAAGRLNVMFIGGFMAGIGNFVKSIPNAIGRGLWAGITFIGREMVVLWSRFFALAQMRLIAFTRGIPGLLNAAFVGIANIFGRIGPWMAALMARLPGPVQRAFGFIGRVLGVAVRNYGGILARFVPFVARFLVGPWGWAIGIILALASNFSKQIQGFFSRLWAGLNNSTGGALGQFVKNVQQFFSNMVMNIYRSIMQLPEGFRNAILGVIHVVEAGAKIVYKLFSYLNPFAHHSPSLVESVVGGFAVIRQAYATISNVGAPFARAASDLARFKQLAASLGNVKMNETQATVAKGDPKNLALFKSLRGDLAALQPLMAAQEAAVNRQQAVVDAWKRSLDAASAALDAQQAKLDVLQGKLDALTNAYQAHEDAMQNFASAPIQGMQAMSDAIFANEIAQKKLQLQMAQWEQVNGSIEDTRNKLASLQGDIEQLTGEAANLRAKGAGSDILGPINAQIDAMKAQQKAMTNAVDQSPVTKMQSELEKLQKQGEILQLQNDIKFDPLVREIDKLAKSEKELPYATIVNGIKNEKAAMAALQPQIDSMTKAVNAQKAAVDAATKARDAISARYDTEQAKLATLNDAYQKTEKLISDIKQALDDMGQAAVDNIQKAEEAARKAKAAKAKSDAVSPGLQNFRDAAGASNFPDVGGAAKIGREGSKLPQDADIKKWVDDQMKQLKRSFGNFDIFKPIRDAWDGLWKWMNEHVTGPISNWWTNAKAAFRKAIFSVFGVADVQQYVGNGMSQTTRTIGDAIRIGLNKNVVQPIKGWWKAHVQPIINTFAPDFRKMGQSIGKAVGDIFREVGPEFAEFKKMWPDLKIILGYMWKSFSMLAKIIGGVLFGAIKLVTSVVASVLGPAFRVIVDIIKNVVKFIRGFIEVIVGLATNDWKMVLKGLWDMINGLIGAIWSVVKGFFSIARGIVMGIVHWFQWLWDVLFGHSIIPDMLAAFFKFFGQLPGKVINFVIDFVKGVIKWLASLPGKAYDAIITFKDKVGSVAKSGFDWFWTKAKDGWKSITGWLGGLPKSAYDSTIKMKDKIGDVSSKAWDWFWTKAKGGWKSITGWFGGLPKSAYDNTIKIKDKIGDVAKAAWDWFWTREKIGWSNTINWFKGLPKNAYDNLINIKNKIGDVAHEAFNWFITKAKDIIGRDNKHGFMYWIASLPGRVANALKGLGGTIADKLKGGWNSAADWINKHGVNNVNKALKLFSVSIPELPKFATGGVIPGKATRKDNTIIAARSGEGVIVPELVRYLGGAHGLKMLNGAAQRGQLRRSKDDIPHFKDGGIVGKLGDMLTGIGDHVNDWLSKGTGFALDHILAPFEPAMRTLFPGRPFIEDWFVGVIKEWRAKAKTWGDNKDSALASGGFGGGGDFGAGSARAKANQAIAQRLLPSYGWSAGQMNPLIALWNGESGWNERARNPSSGAYGIPQSLPANKMASAGADWMTNPATQIRWGMGYIKSVYSTPANAYLKWLARSPHWYDAGGTLKPGLTLARNGTGKDELVLTNADAHAISNVLSMMDRAMSKSGSGATPGTATVARMSASVTSLESRLRAQQTSSTVRSSEGTTININGDLVLPNIKSGNDADTFIKHLKNLAG